MMSSRKIPKQPIESRPTPPRAGFSFPGDTQLAPPVLSDTASHGRRRTAKHQTGTRFSIVTQAAKQAFGKFLASPLLEHILDAYLSYCKVYVTKQSGISLTILCFMPRLGISWLGVYCQPQRPWHKGNRGWSPAWQEGSEAGQEQGPRSFQMDLCLCVPAWAPHRSLPSLDKRRLSNSCGAKKGKGLQQQCTFIKPVIIFLRML